MHYLYMMPSDIWHLPFEQASCDVNEGMVELLTIMHSSGSSKIRRYTWIFRCVAIVAALCFSLVAVIASLHHHTIDRAPSFSLIVTMVSAGNTSPASALKPPHRLGLLSPSLSDGADCPFCDWLTKPVTPIATVAWSAAIALSTAFLLLLSVRLAALWSSPTPRRGFRAPPFACTA